MRGCVCREAYSHVRTPNGPHRGFVCEGVVVSTMGQFVYDRGSWADCNYSFSFTKRLTITYLRLFVSVMEI